jgi:hypothetical protein
VCAPRIGWNNENSRPMFHRKQELGRGPRRVLAERRSRRRLRSPRQYHHALARSYRPSVVRITIHGAVDTFRSSWRATGSGRRCASWLRIECSGAWEGTRPRCTGEAVSRLPTSDRMKHRFAAMHESVVGTSRQFTNTDRFGCNRGHSGHAANPRGASVRRERPISDMRRTGFRSHFYAVSASCQRLVANSVRVLNLKTY